MIHSLHVRFLVVACLAALCVTLLPIARSARAAQPAATPPVRPLISQGSMNVYRRFVPEQRAKMIDFYAQVLALRPLQPIDLGGGTQMILFGIGSGQIKLASGLKEGRQYHLGGVNAGTGIRLITFFFPEEAAVVARFQALGYPAPAFMGNGDGTRAALAQDPAGFTVQLVIVPDAPAETYTKVEVGINVSNLEHSRAFYRDFVGLDELPPVRDALLGVTKYPYRHGATTLNLWSAGRDLPADTGSAGVQYVVSDVDLVDARAKARNVTVEQALGDMPGFALRTVWLNDPDGVTNYFAQVGARGSGGGAATGSGKGKELFATFRCGDCHVLADAGATGLVGPALDGNPNLSEALVLNRITYGQGAMLPYEGQLAEEDIAAIAAYIMRAAAK
jgi:catechol 2,3-dioxygenase-like lactoylglutathione lyase family enzyme